MRILSQVLKGIRTLHPKPEKQAEPLQLRELEQCVAWLERTGAAAREEGDLPWLLRCCRDPSPAADRFLACHPQ